MRKLLGTLLVFGVSKLITKNSSIIDKVENRIIDLVRKKDAQADHDNPIEITYTQETA